LLENIYPLYSSSSSPFSPSLSASSALHSHSDDSSPQLSPSQYTYQEITKRINNLTIDYKNSSYHQTKHHHHATNNPERQHNYLSSSTLSSSSIPFLITPISFHDYICSNDHHPPSKQRIAPYPNIQLSPSPNSPTPPRTTIPNMTPSSTSISSQDDDSFICIKVERKDNSIYPSAMSNSESR